jgi:hypothetical protein
VGGGLTFVRGISAIPADQAITFTCNGNGNPVTTGQKGFITVPYTGAIQELIIFGNVSGSIVVDIWRTHQPTFPTAANTICGGNKPTLSGQQIVLDETLTSWNRTIEKDDILGFNIDSVDGVVGKVTVTLRVT